MPKVDALPRGSVLIRRLYTGVNASDVNFTSGRYHGSKAQAEAELPFNAGDLVSQAAASSCCIRVTYFIRSTKEPEAGWSDVH
jgi:hypothetical protein